MTLSQPSRTAPFDPGRQKTNTPPIRPGHGQARRWRGQGREAHRLVADQVEDHGEAVDDLVEQRLQRLGRHVAAGQTGAAGGDDGVDLAGGDPAQHLGADSRAVVGDQSPASTWPAVAIRSARTRPEVSLSSSRVSETVSTPTRTGFRGRLSSTRPPGAGERAFIEEVSGSVGFSGCIRHRWYRHGVVPRPTSASRRSWAVGSIQRAPSGPISFFQNGARLFR